LGLADDEVESSKAAPSSGDVKQSLDSQPWEEVVTNHLALATQTIHDQLLSLKLERESFEKEKEDWAIIAKKIESVAIPSHIKLNVGGKMFATSLEDLVKISGTMLAGMFSGRWDLKKDPDGSFFIDRDPTTFHLVVQFLRDWPLAPQIDLSLLSAFDRDCLMKDAEFYQIEPLVSMLKPKNGVGMLTAAQSSVQTPSNRVSSFFFDT
jgi:hypothetical protein